jgi:hypothetical protein
MLALLRTPMARCSNPGPPWVWPSARRPAALSGSLVRVTAPGETDSRGRNALRGRRLSSDAAKLDRWWVIRAMLSTTAESVALLGRLVVGCALAPRSTGRDRLPGDRADSRAARSGLRPRARAASGVVAYSEGTLPVPAPTGVVDHHGARRSLVGQLDQPVPGRWLMTSAWPSLSGRRRRWRFRYASEMSRRRMWTRAASGRDPRRCPDKCRWTVACHLRFPCSAQRSVASRQLLPRSGGDQRPPARGPVEQHKRSCDGRGVLIRVVEDVATARDHPAPKTRRPVAGTTWPVPWMWHRPGRLPCCRTLTTGFRVAAAGPMPPPRSGSRPARPGRRGCRRAGTRPGSGNSGCSRSWSRPRGSR